MAGALSAAVAVLFLIGVIQSCSAQDVRGPPPDPLTIKQDKTILLPNDTVTISGKVDPAGAYDSSKQDHVVIEISLPQDTGEYKTIYSAIVPVGPDKSYSHTIAASQVFNSTGSYGVAVTYDNVNAYGVLKFISGPFYLEFEGKRYALNYKIFDGSIKQINIDKGKKSLVLDTIILSENMTIEIPREILDSKGDSGGSADFQVFLDGKEAAFEELDASPFSRTLGIAIPYDNNNPLGKHQIEIMGTHVVPEFGIAAGIVTAAAMLVSFATKKHFT